MCYGCWESEGKPRRLTTKSRLLARYLPEVRSAGPLHCVTEDWNLSDENLAGCEDEILAELDLPPCVERAYAQLERTVLLMLADLPLAERYAAMAAADGYITIKGNYTDITRLAIAHKEDIGAFMAVPVYSHARH